MKDLLYIEPEDVVKLKIKGWNSDLCSHSGAVSWSSPKTDTIVLATPNWEDLMGETPVDKTDYEGNYEGIATIEYRNFKGDLKKQLLYYQMELEVIFNNILKEV